MQTKDIYGKTLSTSFESAITATAQYIKPRVVIDFQDSRHLQNVTITTNDPHSSSANGDLGYYFTKEDVLSSAQYETFCWAVCGALDNDGQPITASGQYVAMPSNLEDDLKYGWWSATKSNASGTFTTNPYIDINFTATTINKVKVVTPVHLGQVKQFTIAVISAGSGTVLNKTYTFNTAINEFEKIINLNQTYTDINRILLTIVSTKNNLDYARILTVSPMYQVDISDYVINTSSSRIRDLHESSLPIAGTSQTSCTISIDNSGKLFNILDTSSQYGKFLQKDIKVHLSSGWKTIALAPDTPVVAYLQTAMNASGDTHLYTNGTVYFPDGDVGNTGLESNYFILTIEEGTNNEEKILIKKKTTDSQFEIQQRGYAGTDAVAHAVGSTVKFDPFEYVNIGTFYLEEISSGSNDMSVSLSLQDGFKFLNEKMLERGIFIQDSTVPNASANMLMFGNFPRKDIIKYHRFSDWPVENGAILQLKFDDVSKNTSNTLGYVYEGLRYRVYQPVDGLESVVKDMKLDAREIELSDLDKAMGLQSSISPTYVGVKSNVNLSAYNFTSDLATADRNTYYQGIFDGYWIPTTTATAQQIGFNVNQGGARLFIDDKLIVDGWTNVTATTYYFTTMDVTAGNAYKVRLEFFHTTSTFSLQLNYINSATIIPSTQLFTNVIDDNIGSKGISSPSTITTLLKNYAIPSKFVSLQQSSSMTWNKNDSSIYLSNSVGNTSVVDSFVRIPYHSSLNPTDATVYPSKDWSIEIIFKAPNGAFGTQGEYISNWANAAPTTGFEFFYISSTNHGIKVKTNAVGTPTVTATSTTAMPNSGTGWNHIFASYSAYYNTIYYYVNGSLHASVSAGSGTPVFGTTDITIGGRGASFTSGVGVVRPTFSGSVAGLNMYLDEFTIYKNYFDAETIKRRYVETQIKEIRKYPFLYGFNQSVYQAIQDITFADLGRMYLNENNQAVCEHYYAFFESSIDQHANVQQTLADSSYIIDANYTKTLQVNSVIVKVAGMASRSVDYQPVWRAPDNTTLGVITLTSNVNTSANSIPVSSFDLIPFPKSGYFIIDSEIIKYTNTSKTAFLNVERGALDTVAANHTVNTKVREVRWFDFQFDKTPVFSIKNPFITGILFEDPDEISLLKWYAGPYKANLIISASNNVESNSVVFAEGTDPITNKVAYTSIAGIPVQTTENAGQIKEQKSTNSENRRKYGLKEITIESPFITNADIAQELADFIILKMSEPIPVLEMNTILTPKLQVGDKIRISQLDQFGIINNDYWVTSIENQIGGSPSQRLVVRKVV